MPYFKRWEPWEDALVLNGERTTASDTKIGRVLGRTATAVRVRRSKIAALGRPHDRWSPDEDEAVVEHYRAFREFSASIGRLPHHVSARGWLLERRRAAG